MKTFSITVKCDTREGLHEGLLYAANVIGLPLGDEVNADDMRVDESYELNTPGGVEELTLTRHD